VVYDADDNDDGRRTVTPPPTKIYFSLIANQMTEDQLDGSHATVDDLYSDKGRIMKHFKTLFW
jgi:hypothetical protein